MCRMPHLGAVPVVGMIPSIPVITLLLAHHLTQPCDGDAAGMETRLIIAGWWIQARTRRVKTKTALDGRRDVDNAGGTRTVTALVVGRVNGSTVHWNRRSCLEPVSTATAGLIVDIGVPTANFEVFPHARGELGSDLYQLRRSQANPKVDGTVICDVLPC